jgi:hypothetical protein
MKKITVLAILLLATIFFSKAQDVKRCIASPTHGEHVVLDGIDNEAFWKTAKVEEINQYCDYSGAQPSKSDYSVHYKMAYDSSNLYCIAYITDDALLSWVEIGQEGWNSDCIEMFFNPMNIEEIMFPFETSSECHFMAGVNDGEKENWFSGQGYVGSADHTHYNYHTFPTDSGYNLEIQLPWNNLFDTTDSNSPIIKPGTEIWWEINGCDADDISAARDLIMGWNADWTESWRNNTRYGKLVLAPDTAVHTNIAKVKSEIAEFKLSPNPAKNTIRLIHLNGYEPTICSIFDIKGNLLLSQAHLTDNRSIDISKLKHGSYVMRVETGKGGISRYKFVKN